MNLSRKLKEWETESVIDGATAERIADYENQHSKPLVLWAVGGLGAFTIAIGLISVIAANWISIPYWIKLAVDLVVGLAIAVALFRTFGNKDAKPDKLWHREVLVILYFGFTLASMALIGQTYQLGGSLAKLFLVWTIATIPLVLLGRGKFLASLWVAGSVTTYVLNMEPLHDFLEALLDSDFIPRVVTASLLLLGPLLLILIARLPRLLGERPGFAGVISKSSWLLIILLGWMCQFLWYESTITRHHDEASAIIGICFIATATMVYFLPRLYPDESVESLLCMRVLLITVFLLGATAVWHSRSLDLVGALTNLLYLGMLAWATLKIKSPGLFRLATALICLRILVIYLEVFGSMLETGVGLIIGGTLTLLIAWWWFKKSGALAQRFGLSGQAMK